MLALIAGAGEVLPLVALSALCHELGHLTALRLVGAREDAVYENARELLTDPAAYAQMAQARNPFGDGHASERIVAAILHHFKNLPKPADYI